MPKQRRFGRGGRPTILICAAVLAGVCLMPVLSSSGAEATVPTAPEHVPVLLVHGYSGEYKDWTETGWATVDGNSPLDRENRHDEWDLYKALSSDVGGADAPSVYLLNYHTAGNATDYYIDTYGNMLAQAVVRIQKETGAPKVLVVAHSMGGLVTRSWLQGLTLMPYRDNLAGLVTLDTPHRGFSGDGMVLPVSKVLDIWPSASWVLGAARVQMNPASPEYALKEWNKPGALRLGPFVYGEFRGNRYPVIDSDGLLTYLEQATPQGVVLASSTPRAHAPVVHSKGLLGLWILTSVLESRQAKDFVEECYDQADAVYQQALQERRSTTLSATSLVVDVSTSMDEPSAGRTKIQAARDAGQTVLDIIRQYTSANSKVGVATFSYGSQSVVEPTEDADAVRRAISDLSTSGNTDILAGIRVGVSQLDSVDGVDDKAIIFLSDGMDTADNPRESIVEAAREAGSAGIRIYTIGFGDSGALDEPLLQEIADVTGGSYGLADARVAMDLVAKMAKAQVVRSGASPILEAQGTVGQGQTVAVGRAVVPATNGDLETVLAWPGSELEVVMTDPSGSKVASGYPGFSVSMTERTAQVRVKGAKPGEWNVEVFGKRTSMAEEPFYAIASFRETSGTPPPTGGGAPASDGTELWILLLGLAAVGGIAAVFLGRRRGANGASAEHTSTRAAEAPAPGVALVDGSGERYRLRVGANTVGRASDNDIVLADASVSRSHALLVVEGDGIAIRDLGSSAGTRVNGVKVAEGALKSGDTLVLGEVELSVAAGPTRDKLKGELE